MPDTDFKLNVLFGVILLAVCSAPIVWKLWEAFVKPLIDRVTEARARAEQLLREATERSERIRIAEVEARMTAQREREEKQRADLAARAAQLHAERAAKEQAEHTARVREVERAAQREREERARAERLDAAIQDILKLRSDQGQ